MENNEMIQEMRKVLTQLMNEKRIVVIDDSEAGLTDLALYLLEESTAILFPQLFDNEAEMEADEECENMSQEVSDTLAVCI